MSENNNNNATLETTQAESTRNEKFSTPRVDIVETDGELLLFADMPGVSPNEIDLHYEQGELVLRGKVQASDPVGQIAFGEFELGDYYRTFRVHETIDAGKIEAEFKNGVLTVHLPKQEAVKPKTVPIKVQA